MFNKRSSGFTLIELVAVIAITGVLSIGVVALLGDWGKSKLEAASVKVKSDIELARSLAMMRRGEVYGVFVDVAGNTYTVYQSTVSTPVPDPQTRQPLIETFSKWPGVTLDGSNYTVEFNRLGAPTIGGGGGFSLTDGSSSKSIAIDALTGRVTLQ